jgi:hypothetical protein
LAADYVGIPQFLDYIRRRLKSYFIHSTEDLERRIQNLDMRADPDGRFRINMFFCFDDTWKMTVVRLIRESDAVLMDLRGFTQANRGCAEELRAIFAEATADRALLVIDASTDLPQLESTLAAALPAEGGLKVRILRAVGAARTVSAVIALLDPAMPLFASSAST